ncbi:MAG: ribonuclease HII [Candidatus Poseidoniaceae archaeon]|jgi:ribonuclease HII|nr:ribonuclease HII [Candidatus Poseidoniaceae archaeon]
MKIGVDEAGRGPVIGPLVVCAFAATSISELIELGVKDSKDLSKKRREELYEVLSQMPHQVVICPPERIDNSTNLNDLEVELFAESLKLMPEGEVILDACDVDAARFARNVSKASSRKCLAEHKADSNYPEVGAASIIAKVTRDRFIADLSDELGIELGSGYPSDPTTKIAVKELVKGKLPHECLRWSWKTVENAWGGKVPPRKGNNQQTLF